MFRLVTLVIHTKLADAFFCGVLTEDSIAWMPRGWRVGARRLSDWLECMEEPLDLAGPVPCIYWRQTGGCVPDGPREPHADVACSREVPTGSSGYCECGGRRRVRESTCDHHPIVCEVECQRLSRYECLGWRETSGCSADGDRVPSKDQRCEQRIDPRASGYCECGDGHVVRKPGCDLGEESEAFTCRRECRREPTLYEELGLDASANSSALKSQFRRLSLKYHPDKTGDDPVGNARYRELRDAFDIVSDADLRGLYDAAGLQAVFDARQGKMDRGPTMSSEVLVDLEDFYSGKVVSTKARRKVICRGCDMQPNTQRCRDCNARCANEIGIQNVQMGGMIFQQEVEVPSSQRCAFRDAKLEANIERGMSAGDSIVFRGLGEQRPQLLPGDVVLSLRASKHKVFKRSGSDLIIDIDISLKEALLGFERSIPHLDGHVVEIVFHGITSPFARLRVDGEGMPRRGEGNAYGDLLVNCNVRMPDDKQLNETQRAWLEANFPDMPVLDTRHKDEL